MAGGVPLALALLPRDVTIAWEVTTAEACSLDAAEQVLADRVAGLLREGGSAVVAEAGRLDALPGVRLAAVLYVATAAAVTPS